MKRGLTATLFITILLASIVFPLINIGKASASGFGTFTFQDQSTITVDGINLGGKDSGPITFADNNIYDTNYNYAPINAPGNLCNPPGGGQYGITLTGRPPKWANNKLNSTIKLGFKSASNCIGISYARNVTIQNPNDTNTKLPSAETTNAWSGSNVVSLPNVSTTPEGAQSYQPVAGSANLYTAQTNDGECDTLGAIVLNSGKIQGKLYAIEGSGGSGNPVTNYPGISGSYNNQTGGGCLVPQVYSIVVGGTPPGATPPGGGGGGGGATGPNITCDIGIDTSSFGSFIGSINPLNWLLCGIIKGMSSIVIALDGQINSWLVIGTNGSTSTDNPTSIFADNGHCSQPYKTTSGATKTACDAYQQAWASFRDLALGLLAIVTLIIIIAQALGTELLDAYTIRRMLPRVVAAAIIITISWPLMRFLVILSNDLGYGIGRLLSGPFNGITDNVSTNGVNGLLGEFAVSIGAIAFGFFGLLSFLATAALAVFVAFLVLVIRQIAVIMLIIFAPIAIIAYALPNTQRVFRLWWDSFFKMLLMFPMIVAFITIGHIFSAIASQPPAGQKTADFIHTVIAMITYFAPYFMIPFTFRFAGGLMSTVGNAVNSRAEGARGVLSKYRSNQAAQNTARLKAGTRFEDKAYLPTRLTRGLNTASRGLGTGWKGRYGLGARGQSARGYAQQAAVTEAQKSQGMQGIRGNNKANRFLAEAMGDEKRGREALNQYLLDGGDLGDEDWTDDTKRKAAVDRAVLDAKAAGQVDAVHGAAAFMSMAADGTAIRDTDDLARLSAKAGQGDRNTTFHYAATAAGISRQANRSDLAAASEPIGELAFAYSDKEFKKTPGSGGMGSGTKFEDLQFAAWKSGAGGEVAYNKYGTAKSRTVRNDTKRAVGIMKAHQAALFRGEDSPHSQDEVEFAAASLVEARNAIANNYGKQNNRKVAGDELEKDDGALDWYLDSGTTVANTSTIANSVDDGTAVQATGKIKVTNRDVVNKIVGDRIQNMTPEQRESAERSRTRPDPGGEEEA